MKRFTSKTFDDEKTDEEKLEKAINKAKFDVKSIEVLSQGKSM